MFVGIVIGLMLGILLALGIAFWLNRSANPFVEKTKPVEALPTLKPTPAKPEPAPPATTGNEKPRFEFYQLLPGEKEAANNGKKTAEAASKPGAESKREAVPAKAAEAAAAPTTPTTPTKGAAAPSPAAKESPKEPAKTASKETYYLQVGAFQNESDADNLKAKIAFVGFEASVRPVNLPDKGTLYRVRLGPYNNADEMNRVKASLAQGGVSASVVKAE
ncbi:MAG: SPOR domain-containing protein [Betaproteobacteria bacterium]|nr:SPOR domain-containing protein [Betaproteobacteria bacterium]